MNEQDMGRLATEAAEARVRADRMALGLSCIADPLRGDMDCMQRLIDSDRRLLLTLCSALECEPGPPDAPWQPILDAVRALRDVRQWRRDFWHEDGGPRMRYVDDRAPLRKLDEIIGGRN